MRRMPLSKEEASVFSMSLILHLGFKALSLALPSSGPWQHFEQGLATLPSQDSPANIWPALMSTVWLGFWFPQRNTANSVLCSYVCSCGFTIRAFKTVEQWWAQHLGYFLTALLMQPSWMLLKGGRCLALTVCRKQFGKAASVPHLSSEKSPEPEPPTKLSTLLLPLQSIVIPNTRDLKCTSGSPSVVSFISALHVFRLLTFHISLRIQFSPVVQFWLQAPWHFSCNCLTNLPSLEISSADALLWCYQRLYLSSKEAMCLFLPSLVKLCTQWKAHISCVLLKWICTRTLQGR